MVKKDTFLFRFLTKQADRKIKEIKCRITDNNREVLEKEIALIKADLNESLRLVETINEESEEDAVNDKIGPNGLIDAFYDIAEIHLSDVNRKLFNKRVQRAIQTYMKYYKIDGFEGHFYSNFATVLPEDANEVSKASHHPSSEMLRIPQYLFEYLLPFQKRSIHFFHSNRSNESGSILADEMGLGKTVQIISYLVSLSIATGQALKCLIICPVTLISHWMTEIRKIYPFFRVLILHSKFASDLKGVFNETVLYDDTSSEYENGGSNINFKDSSSYMSKFYVNTIYITSYETYKMDHGRIIQKLQGFSNDISVCVLDEAHKIKNPNSIIHKTVLKLKEALNPLFLLTTGTPLQNNLIELYALMRMCNNILGGMDDYFNGIVRPIENEIKEITAQRNKEKKRIRKMERSRKICKRLRKNTDQERGTHQHAQLPQGSSKLKYLKLLIAPYILRRTKKSHFFIKKHEFVVPCPISQKQAIEYEKSCEYILKQNNPGILRGVSILRRVLNHPQTVTNTSLLQKYYETEQNDNFQNEKQFCHLTWDELVKESGKMCVIHYLLNKWIFGRKKVHFDDPLIEQDIAHGKKKTKQRKHDFTTKNTTRATNKVLVFSQSLKMLTLLEEYLNRSHIQYLRLDGSTPVEKRDHLVRKFNLSNSELNEQVNLNDLPSVFLLSTRAASLGINLNRANKIIIIDPDWNPSVDKQAIDRACRIGQSRSVTIIRLVCSGSVEECVLGKQVYKEILCGEVLRQTPSHSKLKGTASHSKGGSGLSKSGYSTLLDLDIKNSIELLAPTLTELFTMGDFKLIENYNFEHELEEYIKEDDIPEEIQSNSNIAEEIDESFIETNKIAKNIILSGKEMIQFIVEREDKYGDKETTY